VSATLIAIQLTATMQDSDWVDCVHVSFSSGKCISDLSRFWCSTQS